MGALNRPKAEVFFIVPSRKKYGMSRGSRAEDRRNKSAVGESGRISELKCLELFEGIVPGFAMMQQNLKQHLVKVSRGWRAISRAGC